MTASAEPGAVAHSSQHRLSFGASTSSLPSRQFHSRANSHSISSGPTNSSHRVIRRKSMVSPHSNVAAIAAAVKEAGLQGDNIFTKKALASSKPLSGHRASQSANLSSLTSPTMRSSHLPPTQSNRPAYSRENSNSSVAITDGPPLAAMSTNEKAAGKSPIRRASEGSKSNKPDGKRASATELKCEKCGKGYKHSSCLTKHLWEHTPEWAFTSKLLISKHQQVQLLEAASVLVAMNGGGPQSSEQVVSGFSDHSSASPAASASSEIHDDYPSSAGTTPPPTAADGAFNAKRYSAGINFSRSYQSAPGAAMAFSESMPNGQEWPVHHRQHSDDIRSTLAGSASVNGSQYGDEEQADLAAAVGLLSCSYGTPKSGPTLLSPDVPPVPPLPAKFMAHSLNQQDSNSSVEGGICTEHEPVSSIRYHQYEVKAEGTKAQMEIDNDSDRDNRIAEPSDNLGTADEEEGVFGEMEE